MHLAIIGIVVFVSGRALASPVSISPADWGAGKKAVPGAAKGTITLDACPAPGSALLDVGEDGGVDLTNVNRYPEPGTCTDSTSAIEFVATIARPISPPVTVSQRIVTATKAATVVYQCGNGKPDVLKLKKGAKKDFDKICKGDEVALFVSDHDTTWYRDSVVVRALPIPVSISPADWAAGTKTVPGATKGTINLDACPVPGTVVLDVGESGVVDLTKVNRYPEPGTCTDSTSAIRFVATIARPISPPVTVSQRIVTATKAATVVYQCENGKRDVLKLKEDASKNFDEICKDDGVALFVSDGDTTWYGDSVAVSQEPAKPGEPGTPPPDQSCKRQDCTKACSKSFASDVACFCFDVREDEGISHDTAILHPNTSIGVVAIRKATDKIAFDVSGTPGLTVPGTRPYETPKADDRVQSTSGGVEPACDIVFYQAAPRRPGAVAITVTRNRNGAPKEFKREVIVSNTYAGAFRMGIASIFLNAVDRSYAIWQPPGADHSEIIATSKARAEFEVTFGYAAFFQARAEESPGGIGALFGIGVVGQSGDRLGFLKSIHLGFEYEFDPNFSIAVTAVLRRVSRLAPGLEVGFPYSDASVRTQDTIGLGVGIVINVSPDFFRIAGETAAGAIPR